MDFLQTVCLAYLQLLMNTYAKYQANQTETVGGVVWTRFCGQTECLTDRLIPVYPPPTSFAGILIDRMAFYAAFNSISVISRRQLTLLMLSWVSPVLG